jgi:NAD(P)H-hydrate epimerase
MKIWRLEVKEIEENGMKFITYSMPDLGLLYKRKEDGSKFSFGKVLIIAGSDEYTGAACLTAKAAYRMGAGLVCSLTAASALQVIRSYIPEAIVSSYSKINPHPADENDRLISDEEKLRAKIDWADTVVIGPGLGKTGLSRMVLLDTILEIKELYELDNRLKTLVVDADAINILSDLLTEQCGAYEAATGVEMYIRIRMLCLKKLIDAKVIFTPHEGELGRLFGVPLNKIYEARLNPYLECTRENDFIFVMKSHRTVVAYENYVRYLNTTGNDGMATGGSGDVLAGMIGALSACMEPYEAAKLCVFMHGMAGDIAAAKLGNYSVMASDIIEAVPAVFKKLDEMAEAERLEQEKLLKEKQENRTGFSNYYAS